MGRKRVSTRSKLIAYAVIPDFDNSDLITDQLPFHLFDSSVKRGYFKWDEYDNVCDTLDELVREGIIKSYDIFDISGRKKK